MSRKADAFTRITLATGLLVLLGGATATSAKPYPAEHWQVELGFSGRSGAGLGEMGRSIGSGGGYDLHVTFFPAQWHLGFRTQTVSHRFDETRSPYPTTDWLGNPVTDEVTTWHEMSWVGLGLVWRERLGQGQAQVYVMPGTATFEPQSSSGDGWLQWAPFPLPESETDAVAFGASWVSPPKSLRWLPRDLSVQFGAEFLSGGSCTLYGEPPVVTDEAGNSIASPRRAHLAISAFRFCISRTFPSPAPARRK